MRTFQELVDRAERERWAFWRFIDAIDSLPEPERGKVAAATLQTIAAELQRRREEQRKRLPLAGT